MVPIGRTARERQLRIVGHSHTATLIGRQILNFHSRSSNHRPASYLDQQVPVVFISALTICSVSPKSTSWSYLAPLDVRSESAFISTTNFHVSFDHSSITLSAHRLSFIIIIIIKNWLAATADVIAIIQYRTIILIRSAGATGFTHSGSDNLWADLRATYSGVCAEVT